LLSRADSCPVDAPCTDFLLTDLMMPGMTGIEFLKKVKRMQCKIPEERKAIISGN
jgi:CheY-like chemotaxis protein